MEQGKVRKLFAQAGTLLVLMGVTYYLIFRGKNIHHIINAALDADPLWIAAAVLIMTVYVFCGGWCIRILMSARHRRVSIAKCFRYSLTEIFFSAITPSSTGGQPAQLFQMNRDGFPLMDSSVVLLAVTVLYKCAFLLLAAVLILTNLRYIRGPLSEVRPLAILGLVLNVGLITVLLTVLYSKRIASAVISWGIRLLGRFGIIKSPELRLLWAMEKLEYYHDCAHFFRANPRPVLRTFGVLALQRASLLVIPFCIYRAFHLSNFSLMQIMVTQLLLNLCCDMMPLPGAVGISETIFLVLFGPIFTERLLYSAVLMSRGLSFYLLVFVAGISLCVFQVVDIVRLNRKPDSD